MSKHLDLNGPRPEQRYLVANLMPSGYPIIPIRKVVNERAALIEYRLGAVLLRDPDDEDDRALWDTYHADLQQPKRAWWDPR